MTLREQMVYGPPPDTIAHHGILGMHWGIRRTPAQLGHHTPKPRKLESGKTGDYKNDGETVKQTYGKGKTKLVQSRNGEHPKNPSTESSKLAKVASKSKSSKEKSSDDDKEQKKPVETEKTSEKSNRSKYIKIGVAAAAGAVAAYGAYKVHQIGTDELSRRGGELVGKILGAKDRAVDKAASAKQEFQAAKAISQQKARLKDVLPDRENTMKQAIEKYKSHPEMQASIADWVTRDNKASIRFGSKGNTLRDLEEYLGRAWPSIVK